MQKTLVAASLAGLAALALGCAHEPPRIGTVDVPAWADAQPPPGPSRVDAERFDLIRPRIEAIAKAHHMNLVVDHHGVLYATPDIDFTEALLSRPVGASRAGTRVAIISLERAVETTRDGQQARAALKVEFDGKQAELDARQRALKEKYRDPDALRASPEAAELMTRFRALQGELKEHETAATHALLERLVADVAELARRHGVDVVIETTMKGTEVIYKKGVAYPPPGPDLTDELIRFHDERFGAPQAASPRS